LEEELEIWCISNFDLCLKGTQWSSVFLFNVIVLAATALNMVVMAFGAFFWLPRFLGSIFNCFCACLNLHAFIGVLTHRFSPNGKICAINIAPSTFVGGHKWSDETTYKSDASLLATLGAF